jgi:type III secretion protein U
MGHDADPSDKTEAPTARKIERARQQGQVAVSRDLGHAAGLLAAVCVAGLGLGWATQQLLDLFEALWPALGQPFGAAARALGGLAWHTGLVLCGAIIVPVALCGVLAVRLQAGPVWSMQRLAPRLQHLNLLSGVRRMASMERLAELLKALLKATAALALGWETVSALPGPLSHLPWTDRVHGVGTALWQAGWPIATGALAVFSALSVLDLLDQRRRLTKQLRMSRHELRQEAREQEGDPHLRSHRRQAHQALSQRAAVQAAGQAHVLLVNPTHLAVAIAYDRRTCPVPTVSAKGVDSVAQGMREAAEAAGVPIVRNIPLARELHERSDEGDLVPADLFEVMAKVMMFARYIRSRGGLASIDDSVARPGGVADSAVGG